MEEFENFSIFNYVGYLSKSKRESLERCSELLNSIDISNFNGSVKDTAYKIEETNSIGEIEDQGVKALAENDLIYELENEIENRTFTESESKILKKGQDALLSLLTISIDQIIKEKIPATLKIQKLTLIKGTSSTYFLYNLNNEISDETQILLDRMDIALSSLIEAKNNLDGGVIPENKIEFSEKLLDRLFTEGIIEKVGQGCPTISNFSKSVGEINWKRPLSELGYFAYLFYDGNAVFKNVPVPKIISETFIVKGKPIPLHSIQKSFSNATNCTSHQEYSFPKTWNYLKNIFDDVLSK